MTRPRIRKTKIIATIGPSCDSIETLMDMIRAGMNVARLNFSHGNHEEHHARLEVIREAAKRLDANVATMLDTKGPEIRTGRVEGGVAELVTGARFVLATDGRRGDAESVAVSYQGLPGEVKPGFKILLDDGSIELEVESVAGREICCRVTRGGRLVDHRGVNLPGTSLGISTMSVENQDDIRFAIEHGIVYIAASFVRSARDVREIRELLEVHGAKIPIIAKIENAEGVERLEEIVAVSDGIMVARGDLGVEIPVQEVPMVQKKIIRATVMNGKPVITATQMLETMRTHPTPTRAEVSDVANAIFDGTSAVMLSGETAAGTYPVEAVRTMAALALQAEASLQEYGHLQHILPEPANLITEAVSQAAITMADHLDAAAILALTESGFTARSISKYRPRCPILGVTHQADVVRKFAMNWGVTGVLCSDEAKSDARIDQGIARGRELGYLRSGDVVVVTTGVHRATGSTNMIRIVTLD